MIVHATSVALASRDGLHGILLFGPSGAGKSDLALKLIDSCPLGQTRLISDDRTLLTFPDGVLTATAPPRIAGLMEVRGLGVIAMEIATPQAVTLAFDCLPPSHQPEQIPPQRSKTLCGVAVPAIGIAAFEASAPAKVRLALQAVLKNLFRGESALSEDRTA